MILEMKKFGNVFNSRSAGREAVLRAKQIINGSNDPKGIVVDFSCVDVLAPSYADEFIKGLKEIYKDKILKIQGYENNQVIKETLMTLGFI